MNGIIFEKYLDNIQNVVLVRIRNYPDENEHCVCSLSTFFPRIHMAVPAAKCRSQYCGALTLL